MIDKRITDKPMSFEISLGNAGNSLDGQTQSTAATQNEDGEWMTLYGFESSFCKLQIFSPR